MNQKINRYLIQNQKYFLDSGHLYYRDNFKTIVLCELVCNKWCLLLIFGLRSQYPQNISSSFRQKVRCESFLLNTFTQSITIVLSSFYIISLKSMLLMLKFSFRYKLLFVFFSYKNTYFKFLHLWMYLDL